MTPEQINRTIHEARGLCWHEWRYTEVRWVCSKCPTLGAFDLRDIPKSNPSYTSNWSAYGPMLEWAMKQEWWGRFIDHLYDLVIFQFGKTQFEVLATVVLNPLRGSTALAEFITDHPELFKKGE